MKAGDLNKRVLLQSPTGTRDAVGERSTTWIDVATVWAAIRPMSAREQLVAAQRQHDTSHVIEIRHSSAVAALDASWRLVFGARIFTIDGVLNDRERNEKLILYCSEGVRAE